MPLTSRKIVADARQERDPSDLGVRRALKETFMTVVPKMMRNLDSMEEFSVPSPEFLQKVEDDYKKIRASREQNLRLPQVANTSTSGHYVLKDDKKQKIAHQNRYPNAKHPSKQTNSLQHDHVSQQKRQLNIDVTT